MTRTDATARYRAARLTVIGSDVGGPCTAVGFDAWAVAEVGRSAAALVAFAESAAADAAAFDAKVCAAERRVEVASSNFVCGYDTADSWTGAGQYLAPSESDEDATLHSVLDALEAKADARPEWRD